MGPWLGRLSSGCRTRAQAGLQECWLLPRPHPPRFSKPGPLAGRHVLAQEDHQDHTMCPGPGQKELRSEMRPHRGTPGGTCQKCSAHFSEAARFLSQHLATGSPGHPREQERGQSGWNTWKAGSGAHTSCCEDRGVQGSCVWGKNLGGHFPHTPGPLHTAEPCPAPCQAGLKGGRLSPSASWAGGWGRAQLRVACRGLGSHVPAAGPGGRGAGAAGGRGSGGH